MGVVFTVGYEGTDIERFTRTLLAAGIEVVADVRAVPISRKKGFSKNKLADQLNAVGITYRHFETLGDPKPGREAARAGNIPLFKTIYTAHFNTDDAKECFGILTDVAKDARTVLLCFERDPAVCHRSIVANQLSGDLGYKVVNLFADDPERYVRLNIKDASIYASESLAAAE